jgi:hypothetical protein
MASQRVFLPQDYRLPLEGTLGGARFFAASGLLCSVF